MDATTLTPAIVRERAMRAYLSINQLMQRAGLPNSTFWRWENGTTAEPQPATLQRIEDALQAFEKDRAA